ncbi:unnamed protein product [Amoebophrya sp. A25]|nr:unnamed protein product [Amoebophrya sp. A25]|eukprot:GSA25T00027961001.1
MDYKELVFQRPAWDLSTDTGCVLHFRQAVDLSLYHMRDPDFAAPVAFFHRLGSLRPQWSERPGIPPDQVAQAFATKTLTLGPEDLRLPRVMMDVASVVVDTYLPPDELSWHRWGIPDHVRRFYLLDAPPDFRDGYRNPLHATPVCKPCFNSYAVAAEYDLCHPCLPERDAVDAEQGRPQPEDDQGRRGSYSSSAFSPPSRL